MKKVGIDYYDKNYYSRKSALETLRKGGYASEGVPFDDIAWKWEFVFRNSLVRKGRLLDIGCGTGEFLASAPRGFKRHGVDVSSFAVKEAKKKRGVSAKKANVEKQIPFNGKFDLIVSFDTLEHLPRLDDALKNIKSRLASSGYFFAQVPLKTNFNIFLSKLRLGILDNDPTHCQKHSHKKWLSILGTHFDVVYSKKVLFKQHAVPGFNISGLFVLKRKK